MKCMFNRIQVGEVPTAEDGTYPWGLGTPTSHTRFEQTRVTPMHPIHNILPNWESLSVLCILFWV